MKKKTKIELFSIKLDESIHFHIVIVPSRVAVSKNDSIPVRLVRTVLGANDDLS